MKLDPEVPIESCGIIVHGNWWKPRKCCLNKTIGRGECWKIKAMCVCAMYAPALAPMHLCNHIELENWNVSLGALGSSSSSLGESNLGLRPTQSGYLCHVSNWYQGNWLLSLWYFRISINVFLPVLFIAHRCRFMLKCHGKGSCQMISVSQSKLSKLEIKHYCQIPDLHGVWG